MNIALLAKGWNVSDIYLAQDSRPKAQGLSSSGACGKHMTHCWHDLMFCQACYLVRWNCLYKAEAFWWYKAWLSWAASTGAEICMGKPRE
jgi:hypothetical protein